MARKPKFESWKARREQFEREVRLLVIEGDNGRRKAFDNLLFRLRVPSRAVGSAKQALRLVERERYGALLIAENLPDTHGMTLATTLAQRFPHIAIVLTTDALSLRTLSQAFEVPLADVWPGPFDQLDQLADEVKRLIQRQAEHKMRKVVLDELRAELEGQEADPRAAGLQQRLLAFKRSIGAFDRVLVIEGDDDNMQLFSEHMHLTGLHVETVATLDAALERLAHGDMHMIVIECARHGELPALLEQIRGAHHDIELLLMAARPNVEDGRHALRQRAAAYIPWPPTSLARTAERAQAHLWEARRTRLVDNLFAELYREARDVLALEGLPDFETYRQLIGLERVLHAPKLTVDGDVPMPKSVEFLDDVISEVMSDKERPIPEPRSSEGDDDERRVHARVAHSQFLRFRLEARIAAVMAYLGDLSEGGIFVRSAEVPTAGASVDVDFHVEHRQQRFRVCCHGEVAWVARREDASPHGVGFGVRFVDPSPDVKELLRDIVRHRTSEA